MGYLIVFVLGGLADRFGGPVFASLWAKLKAKIGK